MKLDNKTLNLNQMSFERLGFATLASFSIIPFFLTLFHFLFAWLFGGVVDSYLLVYSSLFMGGVCSYIYYYFGEKNVFNRLLVVCILSVIPSIGIGIDFYSRVTLAFILASVGIITTFLINAIVKELPEEIDGLSKKYKIKTFFFILLAILTITLISRLGVFMNDFQNVEASVLPGIPFFKTHSCLTAYVHAIHLIENGVENIYDTINWSHEANSLYAPFILDAFMYPPPFLLLPKFLFSMTNSFMIMRGIWFGFSGIFISIVFWKIAKWTSARNEWHSIFLIFLVGSSLSVLVTLQTGNIHHVTIAMAILAMYLFERNKPIVGGALLAFAIASKISPGLLCIVLLVQRRWRDLIWTFLFGFLYLILSILIFGIKPVEDFIFYEIPLLRSGQAMYWLDKQTNEILINVSPFGIPFKLKLLGIILDNPWQIAKVIGNAYTVVIIIVTIYFSRLGKNPRQQACLWLGVLTLAGFQSPFAPGYVGIPLLWGITLIAADYKSRKGIFLLAVGWILLTVLIPVPPFSEFVGALFSLFQQLVAFVAIWILLKSKALQIIS